MWKRRFLIRLDDAGADAGSGAAGSGAAAGAGGAADAGAGAGAAAGATGAAAAGAAASAGAAGAAATGAAGAASGAAASGAAAGAAAGATGAAAGAAEVKATWPENWRETVSKDDAKVLARLGRYASPEAALQALIAAQNRIASGELKPVLGAKATPEELKSWREAHGIPETADKYDLKDVKVDDADKALVGELLKTAHASNQTPEQVKATVQAWNNIKRAALDKQAANDRTAQQTSEDSLRAEWGTEFRRNINLIHGLLDGATTPGMKDLVLGGRLSDGTPIGSSPEALKMLVGLALIQNPTGTVVPGGAGVNGEGIREEVEKLSKIPTAKKTEAQSTRQRDLIDAAMKSGFMDANGQWKK